MPTINVVTDVVGILDTDQAAITAAQTDLQTQIDAANAQIAALQATVAALQAQKDVNAEELDKIAAFRALAEQFEVSAGFGAVIVPASPMADPSSATPVTPGITTS